MGPARTWARWGDEELRFFLPFYGVAVSGNVEWISRACQSPV